MRHARFSLWRGERRHETAGMILQDLLRGGEIWLVDETMEKSAPRGVEMAARLLQPESFAMTALIIVPVTSDLMEEVFTRAPALQRTQGDSLARDPRFAIGIYRAAVLTEQWVLSTSNADRGQLHACERSAVAYPKPPKPRLE